MSFEILRSIFRGTRDFSTSTPDIDSFHLISKLSHDPYYNQIKFIPTLIKNNQPPSNGHYFTKQIGCADDIVVVCLKEFNDDNNLNRVEYRALGFNERLQQVLMEAARNSICAKAKWISINSNLLGAKCGNSVIGLLENIHPDANPNLQVEYEIYLGTKLNVKNTTRFIFNFFCIILFKIILLIE